MPDINKSLQWFRDRAGKVTYSMVYRLGPSSYDCSSSVYFALIAGGFLPVGHRIGNTDSLYNDLEKNGWSEVPADANGNIATKKGDIFLWGKRGASGGAAGHTGGFVDGPNIIHCSYGYNGIHVDNHDWLASLNNVQYLTVYRYTGAAYNPPSIQGSPTDQVLEIGSFIRFDNAFAADDVQLQGGIWQVRSDALCKATFTWEDNGIPAEPLVEVDADGYRTADQSLEIGSLYKIPGKFEVLDLGQYNDNKDWIALIEWDGLKFWVDVEKATEVSSGDSGTPVPPTRPAMPTPADPQPIPSDPPSVTEPQNPSPTEDPETPGIPDMPPKEEIPDQPVNPEPLVTNPKEDKPMAFTQEQQKELAVQSQKYLDTAADVAAQNADIVAGIPKKVKVGVYITGDALLGAGAITPQIVTLVTTHDPLTVATTLSSLFATSGLFLLTMFGIYKSGNK